MERLNQRTNFILSSVFVIFTFTTTAQDLELNTNGLYNAELLDNIFRGHFENVDIKRDDSDFFQIYANYLRNYGKRCDDALPSSKVMIMDDVCNKWRVEYNGYGAEINRYCIRYIKEPSGFYARKDLYEAQLELEKFLKVIGFFLYKSF